MRDLSRRYDELGLLLGGFVPVEQASGEVWEQYLGKVDLTKQD